MLLIAPSPLAETAKLMDLPAEDFPSRGSDRLSYSETRKPCRANEIAANDPTSPAPTMATSKSDIDSQVDTSVTVVLW